MTDAPPADTAGAIAWIGRHDAVAGRMMPALAALFVGYVVVVVVATYVSPAAPPADAAVTVGAWPVSRPEPQIAAAGCARQHKCEPEVGILLGRMVLTQIWREAVEGGRLRIHQGSARSRRSSPDSKRAKAEITDWRRNVVNTNANWGLGAENPAVEVRPT
jgi:hypothetical protein